MLFLIEYDRQQGKLVALREFADSERSAAESARLEREITLNGDAGRTEIVLLEAATKHDLERTHRRYFEGLDAFLARPA